MPHGSLLPTCVGLYQFWVKLESARSGLKLSSAWSSDHPFNGAYIDEPRPSRIQTT